MKRQWQIRRHLLATADGQQRWDRAYQALLRWTGPAAVQTVTTSERETGEVRDAGSGVCTGLHTTAGSSTDH